MSLTSHVERLAHDLGLDVGITPSPTQGIKPAYDPQQHQPPPDDDPQDIISAIHAAKRTCLRAHFDDQLAFVDPPRSAPPVPEHDFLRGPRGSHEYEPLRTSCCRVTSVTRAELQDRARRDSLDKTEDPQATSRTGILSHVRKQGSAWGTTTDDLINALSSQKKYAKKRMGVRKANEMDILKHSNSTH